MRPEARPRPAGNPEPPEPADPAAPAGSAARMRPTFQLPLDGSRDEAVAAIRASLADDPELVGRWQGKGRWAEIHVPGAERRLWSPHLAIRIDEEDGRSSLFGRFAPHPEVWTFFMFLYFAVVFAVVFGGIFGYVQWVSSERPWGFWAVGIGVPVLLLLHLASWTGQRLGQEQMVRLRADLERVLERSGRPPSQPSASSGDAPQHVDM